MCDPNLLANVKEMLTYLLVSNPGYNTLESLNNDFLDYVGCQIPYYELGYRYLETFLQSIPDTLRIDMITNAVCLSSNEENTSQSSALVPPKHSPQLLPPLPIRSMNQAVLDLHKHVDIEQPIKTKDNAVVTSLPALSEKQKAAFKKCVSVEYTSDKSIPNCELKLKSHECEGAKNNENLDSWFQSGLHNLKPCVNELVKKCESNTPTLAINDPIQLTEHKYGVKLEMANIESKMAIGKSYELYISEVNNPYKFWFQFDDDSSQLNDFQDQLQLLYSKSTTNSQHIIEKRHMVKGHVCAALYGEQWHRGEIIDEPDETNVKVFFVDFGTVSEVLLTDVRYLMDCFCKLPKLCFRGTLDFIKPFGYRWSHEATTYFNELIFNVKLVAGVSEINSKDNSARIYLMDKTKNINVNYMMVVQGHALPDDPTERYKIHIADVYPTFESLEKGEYPSFGEVDKYLKEGIDVEKIFQSNIIENLNYYTPQGMSDLKATELIQKYYREKKKAKETASKKDSSIFMQLFGHNPFLSGISKRIPENKIRNVSSRNSFTCDD